MIHLLIMISLLGVFQEKEVPKAIRSKLFKQVLTDYPDVRDCVEKAEGGTRKAEEDMTVTEVDVNRDGVSEYEVELSGQCTCGMVNCSIYLYRQSAAGYESLLPDAAGLGLELLKTATNGYRDLQIDYRDTAATQGSTTYKFDGKQYREARSTITQVETGETKPAFRRLQFKPGSSSTTVQGRVSIALPDTFLLRARRTSHDRATHSATQVSKVHGDDFKDHAVVGRQHAQLDRHTPGNRRLPHRRRRR